MAGVAGLLYRHRSLLQEMVGVGAAASAGRLSGLKFEPLSRSRFANPLVLALVGSLAATWAASWITDRRRREMTEGVFAATSVGFATALMVKGITKDWPRN